MNPAEKPITNQEFKQEFNKRVEKLKEEGLAEAVETAETFIEAGQVIDAGDILTCNGGAEELTTDTVYATLRGAPTSLTNGLLSNSFTEAYNIIPRSLCSRLVLRTGVVTRQRRGLQDNTGSFRRDLEVTSMTWNETSLLLGSRTEINLVVQNINGILSDAGTEVRVVDLSLTTPKNVIGPTIQPVSEPSSSPSSMPSETPRYARKIVLYFESELLSCWRFGRVVIHSRCFRYMRTHI